MGQDTGQTMTAPRSKATKAGRDRSPFPIVAFNPDRSNTTTQLDASARLGNTTKDIAPFVAFPKATRKMLPPVAAIAEAKTTNDGFDRPDEWVDLWRPERNGRYYFLRLQYLDGADIPRELRRKTKPGGKITPAIEKLLGERPGSGRSAESRILAERHRGRAVAIAKRLQSDATGRAEG